MKCSGVLPCRRCELGLLLNGLNRWKNQLRFFPGLVIAAGRIIATRRSGVLSLVPGNLDPPLWVLTVFADNDRPGTGISLLSAWPEAQGWSAKNSATMNCIKNADERAVIRIPISIDPLDRESDCLLVTHSEAQRKVSRQVQAVAGFVAMCVLLFSPCLPAQAGLLKPDVDFSNYDVPLFDQVVNRIRVKVAARLGEGDNTQDRYFIVPFAYQNKGNSPAFSHSFLSVIRVFADNKQPRFTPGLRQGQIRNRNFEAFTISWLPHDFDQNSNLCVFDGVGSRVDPKLNKCPTVPGKSFTLPETLKLALNVKNAVGMWGPYEIKKAAFDLGVKRKLLLDGGTIRYRADDRLSRKDQVAINCFHAMAGLEELYPNGGFLGTGFRMWGINGTARVLIEYIKAVRAKGLILEPVDIKRDLYGFVYAPKRNSRGIYNPFPQASAYHE
jgi:hypothetical protein